MACFILGIASQLGLEALISLNKTYMEDTVEIALNGVGKKLRSSFLAGKTSANKLLTVYKRNLKEAERFDGFGLSLFELEMEVKRTHNPLLRQKLAKLVEEYKEKSRCSAKQNELSMKKLQFYLPSALGLGIRKVMKALRKFAKKGDVEARILGTLLEIEFANLYAKKHAALKKVIYERKHILLTRLSKFLCDEGWKCGISSNTGKNAGWIVYVYLPNGTQVSWHCNEYTMLYHFEAIDCSWDGKVCSTLEKLLNYAHENFNIGEPLVEYRTLEAA